MKILVTGGAGFIGSHVVDELLEQEHEVIIVDDLSTGNSDYIPPHVKFYKHTIESEEMDSIFQTERPEAVLHLAAQIDVQNSLQYPQQDASINILGSIRLLELCRNYKTNKIIYSSSAAVYGTPNYLAVDENHPIQPLSSYGISKYTPEKYIQMYSELYHLDYTILRYANVYGPRQISKGEGGVVSIFIDKLMKDDQPVIFGDGTQTRDFVYVTDVARANVLALKNGSREVLNISTGSPTSINELYKIAAEINQSGILPQYAPARDGDIVHSFLDNAKAQHHLGWVPQTTIDTGLHETFEYYRNKHKTKVLL
ncbi:NAD-dependent epimerase/dehydratase family protein [Paenibacillus sp. 1P03SA]|uniref:NAD-dependent epimerase/dehydratase family protein n=1 Tax=Paenibacillus sp. 1P03SA TaxID=3132294 RepID=UPI00399F9A91